MLNRKNNVANRKDVTVYCNECGAGNGGKAWGSSQPGILPAVPVKEDGTGFTDAERDRGIRIGFKFPWF